MTEGVAADLLVFYDGITRNFIIYLVMIIIFIVLLILIIFYLIKKNNDSHKLLIQNNSLPQNLNSQNPPSINYYLQLPPQIFNQLENSSNNNNLPQLNYSSGQIPAGNYMDQYYDLNNSNMSRPIFEEIN